jgi:hypothetical protein
MMYWHLNCQPEILMKTLILSLVIALGLAFIPPAKAQSSTDADTQAILTEVPLEL